MVCDVPNLQNMIAESRSIPRPVAVSKCARTACYREANTLKRVAKEEANERQTRFSHSGCKAKWVWEGERKNVHLHRD